MTPLLADAGRITSEILPDISLRAWRALDAAGKCPKAVTLGRRKLWRVADLERWAALGCPDRREFERLTAPRLAGGAA